MPRRVRTLDKAMKALALLDRHHREADPVDGTGERQDEMNARSAAIMLDLKQDSLAPSV